MLKWKEQIKELREQDMLVRECRKYEEFLPRVKAFAAGQIKNLFTIGSRGSGKSYLIKRIPKVCYTDAAASPVELFAEGYRNKDRTMALDDLDSLFKHKDAVPLFKAFCDLDKPSVVCWKKQNSWLESQEIPTSYRTSSHFCFIANRCPSLDDNMLALLDRSEVVYFFPPPPEVHRYVGTFWNMKLHKDVYDFVGEVSKKATTLSIRWYVNLLNEKTHNNDWKDDFVNLVHGGDKMMEYMATLEASDLTKGEKLKAFCDEFGVCRATYFNYLGDYKDARGEA